MDSKKAKEYINHIKSQIKLHEQILEENLKQVKRYERKRELLGLKPIEIQSLSELLVFNEQERETIKQLEKDLKRYTSQIEHGNTNNGPEDEADI